MNRLTRVKCTSFTRGSFRIPKTERALHPNSMQLPPSCSTQRGRQTEAYRPRWTWLVWSGLGQFQRERRAAAGAVADARETSLAVVLAQRVDQRHDDARA